MRRALVFVFWLSLAGTGCASSGPPGSPSGSAGSEAMISVERFLQASNRGDLTDMARIFGTARGPIADQTGNTLSCGFQRIGSWLRMGQPCLSWAEIELRMNTIAMILRHDDYDLRSESSVAGRTRPTTRVGVDLAIGSERITDVPFVAVQGSGGNWYLEEIGLERITNPR